MTDWGKSRTKQSFKDQCDINIIMARYNKTGDLTHISQAIPQYGDFSNVPDLHGAMNQVRDAQAEFLLFPAKIRDRFGNDPDQLIQFMSNPDNLKEAVELGLVQVQPGEKEASLSPPAPVTDPVTTDSKVQGGE